MAQGLYSPNQHGERKSPVSVELEMVLQHDNKGLGKSSQRRRQRRRSSLGGRRLQPILNTPTSSSPKEGPKKSSRRRGSIGGGGRSNHTNHNSNSTEFSCRTQKRRTSIGSKSTSTHQRTIAAAAAVMEGGGSSRSRRSSIGGTTATSSSHSRDSHFTDTKASSSRRQQRRASLGCGSGHSSGSDTYSHHEYHRYTSSRRALRDGYDNAQQMDWAFTTTTDNEGEEGTTNNTRNPSRELHRQTLSNRAISTRALSTRNLTTVATNTTSPHQAGMSRKRATRRASVGHIVVTTTTTPMVMPSSTSEEGSQSQRVTRTIDNLLDCDMQHSQNHIQPSISASNNADPDRPTHYLKKETSNRSQLSAFSSTGWTVASAKTVSSNESAFSSTGWSVDGNDDSDAVHSILSLKPNMKRRRGGKRPGRENSIPSLLDFKVEY